MTQTQTKPDATLLVIDDESVNRRILKAHLGKEGYAIEEASAGAEALERMASGEIRPDLILLDIMMPEMDGLETCRRIKADPALSDIPVIFLSALTDTKIKTRGLEAGGVDYVGKPFDAKELIARVQTHLTLRRQGGQLKAYAQQLEDMVRERTQELRESENKYRTIFDNTGTAMIMLEADMRVSLFNAEFCDLTGYAPDEIDNLLVPSFFAPEERDKIRTFHSLRRQDAEAAPRSYEVMVMRKDGELRSVVLTVALLHETGQSVVSIMDITGRKRAEEQLFHTAFHDALTGLPNRTMLVDRLADEVALAKEEATHRYAVLIMDLDRFNMVNESLGHDMGDRLLMDLAQRLRSCLGADDNLFRLGGDEFAILVTDLADTAYVHRLCQRVLDIMKQPFILLGNNLFMTISIGVALSDVGNDRGEDVLRDADTALNRAKQAGKERYEFFDHGMRLKVTRLMEMVTDLRLAVERREFVMYFQPIIKLGEGSQDSLAGCTVGGFEALIRWEHPTKGLVSPADFIPVAEETGIIIPMGQWILEESCRRMKAFCTQRVMNDCPLLSVNISGRQFQQENLFETVAATLARTGFPADRLKLEITETVIMDNADMAVHLLKQLKSLNVRLSIDDFGTGYSSLSYLHRFPVDMLKIDRSFVGRMEDAGENLEIVRTIVALAHNLDMEVIAEGVETAQQLATLRQLGCELAQGFYFAKPLSPEALETFDMAKSW